MFGGSIALVLAASLQLSLGSMNAEMRVLSVPFDNSDLQLASPGYDFHNAGYQTVTFDMCTQPTDGLKVGLASVTHDASWVEFVAHEVLDDPHSTCFYDHEYAVIEPADFNLCLDKAIEYNAGAFDVDQDTCYLSQVWRNEKVATCMQGDGTADKWTWMVRKNNLYNFNPCQNINPYHDMLNGNTRLQIQYDGDKCGCYIDWIQMQYMSDWQWTDKFVQDGDSWYYNYTKYGEQATRPSQQAMLYLRPGPGSWEDPIKKLLIQPVNIEYFNGVKVQ